MSNDLEKRYTGTVIWFDNRKGFGFILWEKDGVAQTDLFVHFSDIVSQGFKTLHKDQKISFALGVNKKEQPKATEVTVVQ